MVMWCSTRRPLLASITFFSGCIIFHAFVFYPLLILPERNNRVFLKATFRRRWRRSRDDKHLIIISDSSSPAQVHMALLCGSSTCIHQLAFYKVQTYGSMQILHLRCNRLQTQPAAFKWLKSEVHGQPFSDRGRNSTLCWSFISGSKLVSLPKFTRTFSRRKASTMSAAIAGTISQIASTAFTYGTAAVLPFYTLMVVAPKAELTKQSMESSIPYAALGILYAYLLYLSWTPETLKLIFASKYFLPELPGMMRMFSNEMTMASAWIHLLAIDLFAARQVFQDGLKNNIETRHSVALCLMFCPIGILTHVLTKFICKKE